MEKNSLVKQADNTGKYLKYAIGEIALVVIGILIALSINNWNESRKDQLLEIDILKEIRNALKDDLKDAQDNLSVHREKLTSQNIVIDWMENDQHFADSLSLHFETIEYGTFFEFYEGPYKTLNQTGMRIIKNDSLRNQISKLYDQVYESYNVFNRAYSQRIDENKKLNPIYFNEWSNNEGKMEPLNSANLKLDNRYLYLLKSSKNFNSVLVSIKIPQVISEINTTMQMINNELEARN
ncbi:hypothetical protein BST83_06050 [Polaribacter filamentus]|uniref:Uncharacterized protein n=2 Tax=Polaribacter filamentus TaxID=53483 RepID=A0A2S7KVU4_9FLAO|nr:hypothetical protein BST83_06050 [Polaribacter filamentus]